MSVTRNPDGSLESYQAGYHCNNCQYDGDFDRIPMGIRIIDATCDNCDCKTLVPRAVHSIATMTKFQLYTRVLTELHPRANGGDSQKARTNLQDVLVELRRMASEERKDPTGQETEDDAELEATRWVNARAGILS